MEASSRAASFSFIALSSAITAFAFSREAFLLSCVWIALSILGYKLDLGSGHNGENIAVEMHRAALVFGVREHLAHGLQHPHALVADDELHAVQTAPTQPEVVVRFRS